MVHICIMEKQKETMMNLMVSLAKNLRKIHGHMLIHTENIL